MEEPTPQKTPPKKAKFTFREWHRTVLLVVLLAIAIYFILWSRNQYQSNFIDQF